MKTIFFFILILALALLVQCKKSSSHNDHEPPTYGVIGSGANGVPAISDTSLPTGRYIIRTRSLCQAATPFFVKPRFNEELVMNYMPAADTLSSSLDTVDAWHVLRSWRLGYGPFYVIYRRFTDASGSYYSTWTQGGVSSDYDVFGPSGRLTCHNSMVLPYDSFSSNPAQPVIYFFRLIPTSGKYFRIVNCTGWKMCTTSADPVTGDCLTMPPTFRPRNTYCRSYVENSVRDTICFVDEFTFQKID